jgi:hypothetical protein
VLVLIIFYSQSSMVMAKNKNDPTKHTFGVIYRLDFGIRELISDEDLKILRGTERQNIRLATSRHTAYDSIETI